MGHLLFWLFPCIKAQIPDPVPTITNVMNNLNHVEE